MKSARLSKILIAALPVIGVLTVAGFTYPQRNNGSKEENKSTIQWMTLEEADKAMKEEPKKVLIDVYTHWCGPCKAMMKQTFGNEKVAEYINEYFYAIKFNAEGSDTINFRGKTFVNPDYDASRKGRNATHQLTRAIAPVKGRIAYPTVVYMDENFDIISPVQGFLRPKQIEPLLKFIATDSYKEMEWEKFQKDFESEF